VKAHSFVALPLPLSKVGEEGRSSHPSDFKSKRLVRLGSIGLVRYAPRHVWRGSTSTATCSNQNTMLT